MSSEQMYHLLRERERDFINILKLFVVYVWERDENV